MQIRSERNKEMCLTQKTPALEDSVAPIMSNCSIGDDSQLWILKNGQIRPYNYPNNCMFVDNDGIGTHDGIYIAPCRHDFTSQKKWNTAYGNVIRSDVHNKCLVEDLNILKAVPCTYNNQAWTTTVPDISTQTTQYKSVSEESKTKKKICVHADTADGPITLKECDTSNNQQWIFRNAEFASKQFSDSCMYIGDNKPYLGKCGSNLPSQYGWKYYQSSIQNGNIALSNNNGNLILEPPASAEQQKFIPINPTTIKTPSTYINDPTTQYPDLTFDDQLNGAEVSIHFPDHDFNAITANPLLIRNINSNSSFINELKNTSLDWADVFRVERVGDTDRYVLKVAGTDYNYYMTAYLGFISTNIYNPSSLGELNHFKFEQLPDNKDKPNEYRMRRADNGQYIRWSVSPGPCATGVCPRQVDFTDNPEDKQAIRINIIKPSKTMATFLNDRANDTITSYDNVQGTMEPSAFTSDNTIKGTNWSNIDKILLVVCIILILIIIVAAFIYWRRHRILGT